METEVELVVEVCSACDGRGTLRVDYSTWDFWGGVTESYWASCESCSGTGYEGAEYLEVAV